MNQNLKVWHLLAIAVGLFVVYYLFAEFGGRHGTPPGVYTNGENAQTGTLVTKP